MNKVTSKAKVKAHFKEMLNSYKVGDLVSHEHYEELVDLLASHPRGTSKLELGAISIKVAQAPYGGRCFHLVRPDLTEDGFSYLKCVDGDAKAFTRFSQACRRAVEPDVLRFRYQHTANGQGTCSVHGDTLSQDQLHVDHAPPMLFSVIVSSFIKSRSIDLDQVAYIDNSYGHKLADQELEKHFQDYHIQRAQLRMICKTHNLKTAHLGKQYAT